MLFDGGAIFCSPTAWISSIWLAIVSCHAYAGTSLRQLVVVWDMGKWLQCRDAPEDLALASL